MSKKAIWENPNPTVYRIKSVKKGTYICGGHGAMNGLYGSLTGVKLGLKNALEGWWHNEDDEYVIEICELVVKETITPEELKGRKQ